MNNNYSKNFHSIKTLFLFLCLMLVVSNGYGENLKNNSLGNSILFGIPYKKIKTNKTEEGNNNIKLIACSTTTPTGSTLQNFCSTNSPTVASLIATGTSIKWYATATGGSPLLSTTSLTNNTHYYATQTISSCESPVRLDVTVIIGTSPGTTGVNICQGASGSLTSSGPCSNISTTLSTSGLDGTSNNGSYGGIGNTDISVSFPTLPVGATVTSIKTFITYTSISPSYRSELRVAVTPPVLVGLTQTDLQPSTLASAGVITDQQIGSWGTGNPTGTWLFRFRETYDDSINPDATISNVTITVAYTITNSIEWYTASSGGSAIGSGSPFNPVGVPGSGLINTNTVGTTIYYAACSKNADCRTPTSFSISANQTVSAASSSPTLCITKPLTNITHTTTGATGIGTPTGLPTGVTASWASNTITISGTPTTIGIYNYSIPLTGGCNAINVPQEQLQ